MTAAPDPTPRERAEHFIEDAAARLGSPIRLATEAAKIGGALAKADPEAWNQFVNDVTVEVIVSRLRSILASDRYAAVHAERRSVFTRLHDDTITAIESGEAPPSPFDARYALPGTNNWLRLGDMTRLDLYAVSRHRTALARTNALEAIFLAALADRLPDDTTTVAEAITEADIVGLHTKAEAADLGDLPIPPTTDTDPEENEDD